ncbi:MAG: hypothetical protein HY036_11905 [Nitrospirae bacterium]|nr:hypothetical protein [Nitrospirota bacterium]
MIKDLIQAFNSYQNDQRYATFPNSFISGYNSNSFNSGLSNTALGNIPTLDNSNFATPGYSTALPLYIPPDLLNQVVGNSTNCIPCNPNGSQAVPDPLTLSNAFPISGMTDSSGNPIYNNNPGVSDPAVPSYTDSGSCMLTNSC